MAKSARLRVGVMGAGAVGCYVGGWLAQEVAVDVVWVGRAALQAQVRAEGLRVIDLSGTERVADGTNLTFETEPEVLSECDVVLCCVKSGHTDDVARTLAKILASDAIVVSLQNGVRNADVLRGHLGDRLVLAGVVEFNVVPSGPGAFKQTTMGSLLVQASGDPRCVELFKALETHGPGVKLHRDLAPHQWAKLLLNLSNSVSALSGVPTPDMVLSAGYRRVIAEIVREAAGVLRAAGVRTATLRGLPARWFPALMGLPTWLIRVVAKSQLGADPLARSSMWTDLSKGRKTEVDYLNGEIVRLGDDVGRPAPINRRVVELVHEVEARGAGSPQLGAEALWSELAPRSQ
jgi:2-dehydropantoate 2-reductase